MMINLRYYSSTQFPLKFSLGTDDDDRVVLESISDGVDCEHDYMNATYIDVRALKVSDIRPL